MPQEPLRRRGVMSDYIATIEPHDTSLIKTGLAFASVSADSFALEGSSQ